MASRQWFRLCSNFASPRVSCYAALRYTVGGGRLDITVLQLPKFKNKAMELIGAEGIEAVAVCLVDHPDAGDMIEQVWPRPIDVKAIRKQVKMSQAEFARVYGISKRALQEWEQGGRQPDSAVRADLTVVAREPAVVRRALAGD